MGIFIADVEVDAVRCSVLVEGSFVVAMGADIVRPLDSYLIDGNSGTLLPGLHDHHVHLLSDAATTRSVVVGPPDVCTSQEFRRVLGDAARAPGRNSIRAIGYHESVAGLLDRHVLDEIVAARPVRVQHRSGSMWFLNSLCIEQSGLDDVRDPGVERDAGGRVTGRLFRGDHYFGIGEGTNIDDLRSLSHDAARRGVTGFTDATPNQTSTGIEALVAAHDRGAILQHLTLMSPADVEVPSRDGVDAGPVKVLLDDVGLPSLEELVDTIARAHRANRAVAIHCVTDLQTALALSAIDVAGPNGRDRIEHGSIMPVAFDALARACRVTVVTQPHFVSERGDDYLRDVPERLHDVLYRARSLLDAGVGVAGGTDAPFGSNDPWDAIAAATRRTTRSGEVLGSHERLSAREAIGLFTGQAHRPARPRRVEVGARADLCLLALDTASALEDLSSQNVRATIIDGRVVHER